MCRRNTHATCAGLGVGRGKIAEGDPSCDLLGKQTGLVGGGRVASARCSQRSRSCFILRRSSFVRSCLCVLCSLRVELFVEVRFGMSPPRSDFVLPLLMKRQLFLSSHWRVDANVVTGLVLIKLLLSFFLSFFFFFLFHSEGQDREMYVWMLWG